MLFRSRVTAGMFTVGETVTLSAVGAPGLTLPNTANTHYLVIVEVNANNRVVKAGAVEVTGVA